MITLITGAPGSGKSLYCVDKLLRGEVGKTIKLEGRDGDEDQVVERRIYSNINGLLLDHELVDGAWLEGLHKNRAVGSLVVFDEVQRVWPNRVANSKKPDAVEYLETHRHDGLDVILLTQNPQLLDPAVRALVGRHLHMRRVGGLGAAVVYEWDSCSNQLRYKAAFTKTPYRYSRRAFKLYRSARVHTKQKRRLPFALWMALAGVGGAAVAWPLMFDRLTGHAGVAAEKAAAPAEAVERPALPEGMGDYVLFDDGASAGKSESGWSVPSFGGPMTAVAYVASFEPRVEGLDYTAPRYDGLTHALAVPVPAACVSMGDVCRCYTQRATPLDVDEALCRQVVDEGLFLDFVPDGGGAAVVPMPAMVVSGE